MSRRAFLKKALGSLLAFVGLSGGTYYYAREMEPAMLSINEQEILSGRIPAAFQNYRIVQFSDTHIGFHYTLEQFRGLIAKINELEPDLLLFTGDLVDEPHIYNWNQNIVEHLSALKAKDGKYWIYGNHDHGGYGTDILLDVMEEGGFNLLRNSHTTIQKNRERIVLAGIDDLMLGRPDLRETLANANPDLFTILLAHEPDFADIAKDYPVDVQLSGHSHGGQVRFPFIGHLYTPVYAEKYVQGKYVLNDGNFTVHVNSGIGTTRLPYRFLCRPEIHVYTLKRS
ncbi:metallophosphoesterase [Lentibacillus sediminis]|uniref:metallophosphoesterase n=1 Tax=Lentibacillus sediminis TaxID=1940529 RepID=UPI000C1C4BC6|nr:metallophosphoesterase [Lentibacillus sediminis]